MKARLLLVTMATVGLAAAVVVVVQGRDDLPPPDRPPPVPLPSSMAAIGDSITAGVGAAPDDFNVAPEHAWATGRADDDVVSHYERLLALDAPVEGRRENFAVPGAKMADGPDQARRSVASGASYVTILLGANDICTATAEAMTPVAQFEDDFRTTLQILDSGLPDAVFFVLSIPDIHRLWETFEGHPAVRKLWETSGTCGSMFGRDSTDTGRRAARARNAAYNEVLETVCAEKQRCRFDNKAIFHHEFGRDLVAPDFFHPSHRGHEVLAELTWRYGYWPESRART